MKKRIRATIHNMADNEVLNMIPPDTLARIKSSDPNPEFRVYCVGHEGTAYGSDVSLGRRVTRAMKYMRDVVVKLANKLSVGTPLFNKHGRTNSHTGRSQIGEIVGKAVDFVGDKVAALAATYIYPKYRDLPLDIASIEADIEYVEEGKDAEAIDVEQITGIALGNSKEEKPAFSGATLLGVVQAFASKRKNRGEDEGDEDMKITKEEVLDAIKDLGLAITDLFTPEEITASEPAKKAKQTEYEHAKRVEKALKDEREKVIDLTKERDEAQGKIKVLNKKANVAVTRDLLTKAVEVRKFDDKQKAFIEKNISKFESENEGEILDQDFGKWLDGQVKEFEETAKLLGVEIKPAAGDDKNKGTPSSDGKGTPVTEDTAADPTKNDFIPQDEPSGDK